MLNDLRLTLEILHDVQESVINVRLVDESHLDLIQVAESILVRDVRKPPPTFFPRRTYIQDGLLSLGESRDISWDLLS